MRSNGFVVQQIQRLYLTHKNRGNTLVSEFNPKLRRKARHLALQALYQWQISQTNIQDIEMQYLEYHEPSKFDVEYFRELLAQIPSTFDQLDEILSQYLDRTVDELTPIELIILRMGAYELQHRLDIPYRVSINEAIELAKEFGANESHKYVNGVLDKLAAVTRTTEMQKQ